MRMNQALLILVIVAGTAACQSDQAGYGSAASGSEGSAKEKTDPGRTAGVSAVARLQNAAGESVGTATFTEAPGGVMVRAEFSSLPPGPHGLHIHENSSCEPPQFTSAGDHFNPDGKQHGLDNPNGPHAGDLPNLSVAEDGKAKVEYLAPHVSLREGATNSLLKPGGTSLVIHTGADDDKTDPAGGSGDRVACGAIVRN